MHWPWLWHSDRYWRRLWWDFSSKITNLVVVLIVLNLSVRYHLFLILNWSVSQVLKGNISLRDPITEVFPQFRRYQSPFLWSDPSVSFQWQDHILSLSSSSILCWISRTLHEILRKRRGWWRRGNVSLFAPFFPPTERERERERDFFSDEMRGTGGRSCCDGPGEQELTDWADTDWDWRAWPPSLTDNLIWSSPGNAGTGTQSGAERWKSGGGKMEDH